VGAAEALIGVDAVVNLSGEPVADKRWTNERKSLISDTRVLGTRRLAEATLKHGQSIRTFVQGSAIGSTVTAPTKRCPRTARREPASRRCGRGLGGELRPLAERRPDVRVATVRTGIVLARHGGALRRCCRCSRVGRRKARAGRQWNELDPHRRHRRIVPACARFAATGVLEGVAPQPVPNREFTKSLCRSLRVMENAPVPSLAIRALYGEMGGIVLESAKVEPRRTLASGYRYRFESIAQAFAGLLAPLQGSTREKVAEQWVPHPPERHLAVFSATRGIWRSSLRNP